MGSRPTQHTAYMILPVSFPQAQHKGCGSAAGKDTHRALVGFEAMLHMKWLPRATLFVFGKGETVVIVSNIVSSENAIQNIKHLSGIQKGGTHIFNKQNIDSLLAERPVYVVTPSKGYCPEFLLDNYGFEKKGVLYQVVKDF